MSEAYTSLAERGFIQQATDEAELKSLLSKPGVRFYVGFDPTGDSLHAGSLVPIMAMAHLQRAGHVPIAVIGAGTTMIGDPSGKTEMRQMMSLEEIQANGEKLLDQLKRYLEFDEGRGLFLNNADWLMNLNYIEFLRDIGKHFRVNEMINKEAYRARLERQEGLSFIEFNYQLLQAYDFLVLFQNHGCTVQMGGNDQWGNIVSGADLIRRVEGGSAHGLTFPLLTTAGGAKMGKTEGGAVWLDSTKTAPYDFYQYWINVDDRDVKRFLAFFTFLPIEEVERLGALSGADLRTAKETLAYEATKLAHGKDEAESARTASRAAFGGGGSDVSGVPTHEIESARLQAGIPIMDMFVEVGLAKSKSEYRRLIAQGGAYIDGNRITDLDMTFDASHIEDGGVMLRSGKKRYHRIVAR